MQQSRYIFILLFFIIGSSFIPAMPNFEAQQLGFDRVKNAYQNKEAKVRTYCQAAKIDPDKFGNVLFRVFKNEMIFEVWIENDDADFVKLAEYPICDASGKLGPKRQQGDRQVPEGFYSINVFNPQSNYYLSLGVDYPNASDRILSTASNRGGDIYIHGKCASIGCMAMTDEYIEEIYVMAVKARNQGQEKIPVHIFPFRMTENNLAAFKGTVTKETYDLWSNLQDGYDYFDVYSMLPEITIDAKGVYHFD